LPVIAQRVKLNLIASRTSDTGNTAWMNAVSRHIRGGGSTMDPILITMEDRRWALLSRLLTALRLPWGDELIVVLEKPGLLRVRTRSRQSAHQPATPESLASTSGAHPSM
jgi:hypothetical protein